MSMIEPWRLLPLMVALGVTVGAGVAAAQTVIVRSAPREATIEAQVNAEGAQSAKADTNGDATLTVKMPSAVSQTNVRVYVDTCLDVLRVRLVETGRQPGPPEAACSRSEIPGVFVMAPVTTFVVDLDGANAVVHLRQGPVPPEWVRRGEGPAKRINWGTPRAGLELSAGVGLAKFSDAVQVTCGTVTSCAGKDLRGTLAVGAMYWIKPYVAAQVSYLKPGKVTASGSGNGFRFDSTLDTRIMTIAANVGGPIGPVRVYGLGGWNHHQATFGTTETFDDTTVVVDNVTQTIKGGTQAFELKTAGWGWLFGGGLEAWAKRSVAFYAEGQFARLKGAAVGGVEGAMDDHLFVLQVGARVRLGR
jgi:hypothetical protein